MLASFRCMRGEECTWLEVAVEVAMLVDVGEAAKDLEGPFADLGLRHQLRLLLHQLVQVAVLPQPCKAQCITGLSNIAHASFCLPSRICLLMGSPPSGEINASRHLYSAWNSFPKSLGGVQWSTVGTQHHKAPRLTHAALKVEVDNIPCTQRRRTAHRARG